MYGAWFRGRPLPYDPDAQRTELARQAWVYRAGAEYERYRDHRDAYVRTGDLLELALALEYVTL